MLQTFSLNQNLPDLPDHAAEAGPVCIANISPKERRKRMHFSIVQFSIGLILLAALILLGADPVWRLPLFFLFSAGGASYFQAKDKT